MKQKKLTRNLPNISRLWWKCLTHPKTDQWPATIRQVEQATNNLLDVGRFDAEKINIICKSPKVTNDLPNISRLRWKCLTHPKTDQWPANIRQVEQATNNLWYVGRFDPEEKVWINLLDVGRFVDTFSTCSYMAGGPECYEQCYHTLQYTHSAYTVHCGEELCRCSLVGPSSVLNSHIRKLAKIAAMQLQLDMVLTTKWEAQAYLLSSFSSILT